MKSKYIFIIVICWTFVLPRAVADNREDKLDAILQELRSLNGRVTRLEKQVENLMNTKPGDARKEREEVKDMPKESILPVIKPEPIRVRQLPRRRSTPEEVIRLQFESPGELLKGIHERERLLRQRDFPPEIYSPR